MDFLCVGDATRDLFLFLDQAGVNGPKLELDYGCKIPVKEIAWSLGGNAANVSVGLNKLGVRAALVTVFGDDDRGAWIKRQLLNNGVDLTNCETEQKRQSNLSTILVFQGERTILSYHANGKDFTSSIPASQWLYLTSSSGRDSTTMFEKVLNIPSKLTFNPSMEDIKKKSEIFLRVIAKTDVLILNKEECEALGTKGPKITAVTDGKNGVTVYDSNKVVTKPAVGVKAIETTGAGDAFSSGFLAALFYGKTLEEAADWGLRNSGSVIQKVGAIEGLLSNEELKGKS